MGLKSFFEPEAFTLRYWIHITLDAIIILAILQYFTGGEMFNLKNILLSIPLIGIPDIIVHGIFKQLGYST